MPELPEVETIRRALAPALVNAHITGVTLIDPTIAGPDGPEPLASVTGATVTSLVRRGKYLILLLGDNRGVVAHLRMTGTLLLGEPPAMSRVRAILYFSNGERLSFSDTRRLGTLRVLEDIQPVIEALGPEPLAEDFTGQLLAARLSSHRIPIKAALLDQGIVAGLGNMYADEALFEAGIHPLMLACKLTHRQVRKLRAAIRNVLERAIARHGASVRTYRLPGGERGTAQEEFCVAHRKGAPCPQCGTPVERVMVRKRGAYFCPRCQT